jgi:mono/diheme cytochrome c family protein
MSPRGLEQFTNVKPDPNAKQRTGEEVGGDVEARRDGKACRDVEERRFSAASSAPADAGFSPRGRAFYPITLTAVALLALASPFFAVAQKPTAANTTADLPAGAMQAKATTSCLECHEARIILQQRLSKAAWTKEVDKMTKWGAVVDPADRDPLIDYLSTNFSPDKPPYDPQRTAGDKSSSGKSSK